MPTTTVRIDRAGRIIEDIWKGGDRAKFALANYTTPPRCPPIKRSPNIC
jgi:hypothetical protein